MDPFQGGDELESRGTSLGFGCTLLIHLKEKQKKEEQGMVTVSPLSQHTMI